MSQLARPLSDVTVLELGHIVAGPYCSLLLADLGAEVIKVEHPEYGDALRDSSEGGNSLFNYVNRNKKSVTVDLKGDDGGEVFMELVKKADVLVENYSPGTAERLGVGYDRLREVNPELVYCSIKGFNEGPYENRPALDPVAEALSGLMSTTGYPEHPPARCGTSIADMVASFHGALGVIGALRQRDRDGGGQKLVSPMFEGTVGLMGGSIAYGETTGNPSEPLQGGGQSQWAPYGVFLTNDDQWVFIGPSSEAHWQELCAALGLDEMVNDERFRTLPDRRENRDALDSRLEDIIRGFTREELLGRLEDQNVPVAPVNNTLEVADDPHLNETGGLVEITTAEGEAMSIRVPAGPLDATGFERPEPDDPPRLGEDTADVLGSLGFSDERIAELRENGAV